MQKKYFPKGDKVVYKIRIYNEGNVNGYASTVIDYLPTGLKLADNSTINTQYGWKTTKDVGTAKTTYLADKMINKNPIRKVFQVLKLLIKSFHKRNKQKDIKIIIELGLIIFAIPTKIPLKT